MKCIAMLFSRFVVVSHSGIFDEFYYYSTFASMSKKNSSNERSKRLWNVTHCTATIWRDFYNHMRMSNNNKIRQKYHCETGRKRKGTRQSLCQFQSRLCRFGTVAAAAKYLLFDALKLFSHRFIGRTVKKENHAS